MPRVEIHQLDIGEILKKIRDEDKDQPIPELQAEARAKALPELLEKLLSGGLKDPGRGDLIQLRTDITSPYTKPRKGEPAIVIDPSIEPQFVTDGGNIYKDETMLVGVMTENSGFVTFAMDPLYFEPYTGPK